MHAVSGGLGLRPKAPFPGPHHGAVQDLRVLEEDRKAWLQFLLQLQGLTHLLRVRVHLSVPLQDDS